MRNENVNIDMFWPHDLAQYWWWWKEKGPYPLTTHLKWERSLKGISFKCGKRAAVVGQNSEQLGCTTANQTIDSTKWPEVKIPDNYLDNIHRERMFKQ